MKYWTIEWKSRRYPHKSYSFMTFYYKDYRRILDLVLEIEDYQSVTETEYTFNP